MRRIYSEEFQFDKYSLRDFHARERFCRNYTWAIPSQKAIQSIVKFSAGEEIIEIGAGKGYWAKLINSFGGKIQCYDLLETFELYFDSPTSPKDLSKTFEGFQTFYPVTFCLTRNEIYSRITDPKILMFCWPECSDPWAYEYLKEFAPQKLIFIGEWEGGCCAEDQFFDFLTSHYKEVERIEIPRWSCIHDAVWFFEKCL